MLNNIFVVIFIFFGVTNFALGATQIVWSPAPQFSGVSGIVHSDVAVTSSGVYTYGLGNVTVPFSTWNVADFTQFKTASPLFLYQTSSSASPSYGATSIQVQGNRMAAQMHTWSMPNNSNSTGDVIIKNITYGGGYPQGSIYAWDSKYGVNPSLCLSYSISVPDYYNPGASALYIGGNMYILDANNKAISLLFGTWDSRGVPQFEGYLGYDAPTNSHMIATPYQVNTRYSTLQVPYSATSSTGKFSSLKWYGSCISVDNLKNIISDLNARGLGYSKDPTKYKITGHAVQPEIAIINNSQAWFSSNIENVWLVSYY